MVPDKTITEEELLAYRADGHYNENSNVRKIVATLTGTSSDNSDDVKAALALLATWDGNTNLDNRAAGLAILTGMRAKGYEIKDDNMPLMDALKDAMADLNTVYGRIDPTWGEVNRLRRGDTDLPLTGGPDTLRAIYGLHEKFVENKGLTAVAGDTHIMYADWDEDGNLELKSIHQFGAATQDKSSPHYDDQAKLFAKGEYKTMPMTLEEVLPLATRDYTPGK